MRIDVINIRGDVVSIAIVTGKRSIMAEISRTSYLALKSDGFFLRPRDTMDGIGRINVSRQYVFEEYPAGDEKNFTDGLE